MSGIFGIFNKSGAPVTEAGLSAMQAAMAHWGPHGQGLWRAKALGLGHQLLCDTPESRHERQPESHPSLGDLVITADARIDNRDELCEALRIPAAERATTTDSRLILFAYERWGEACAGKLLGDFAFAIWDRRRQTLFCARDHMGCRPFYYHDGPGSFVFASDIPAVLAVEEVPQRLDDVMVLVQYLGIAHHHKDRTCFMDVVRLPAGHSLSLRDGRPRLRRYWQAETQAQIRLGSEGDYAAMLRGQLERAVSCRLRAAGPLGAHISGGLDSSSVAVLAARQLRGQGQALGHAYSWTPPSSGAQGADTLSTAGGDHMSGGQKDERNLIDMICAQENISCTYTTTTPEDVVEYMSRDVSVEPTDTQLQELIVCRNAAAHGVRVLLSGWGGDEGVSFNGRGHLSEAFLRGHWAMLYRAGRLGAHAQGPAAWKALVKGIFMPLLPDAVHILRGNDLPELARRILVHEEVRRAPMTSEARGQLRRQWRLVRERAGVHANQIRLLRSGHLTHRMEAWAAAGARHSLNYRYPLLDVRLLELCLALPSHLFYHVDGNKRRLFRLALEGILPDEVRWGAKTDPVLEKSRQSVFQDGRLQFREQWNKGLIAGRSEAGSRVLAQAAQIDELLSLDQGK